MLRLKEFMAEGIGPETLASLVREAAVVRPARGLYQLPDTQTEAAHMARPPSWSQRESSV